MRTIITTLASAFAGLLASVTHANDEWDWEGPMPSTPSIEEFLTESGLQDMAISPSGAMLASLKHWHGRNILTITDTETQETIKQGSLPAGASPLWITWANNDRLLMALVIGQFRVTSRRIEIPSARIVAMNLDGSDSVALFENQRSVMRGTWNLTNVTDILPNDPDHILMPGVRGGDLDLWKVNVNTGEAERVALGGSSTFAWKTDASGAPAFRFDMNARGTVMRVFAPDAGGKWRRVATVREDDLPAFRPVASGPEPGLSYVIARPQDVDRAGVYLYNAEENRFTQEIATHPRVDIEGVFFNPRTGEYLGYYVFDDAFQAHFVDQSLQSHVDGLQSFFGPSASFTIHDMSDDSSKWIIVASAPNDPGGLYLYDRTTSHVEPLERSYPTLTSIRMGETQVVRYTASDGLEITGYLTLPPRDKGGPRPLILMPHGGPEVRDILTYNEDAQFLATRGYAVFQPNFRGSSGFGRAFAEAGYREWGGRMQDDLTDAVAHLVTTGVADPQRVCILGGSYGGYAALAGAAFTPHLYQCAISIAGVSDLADQARHFLREGDDEEDEYVLKAIGHPRRDRDALAARSPVHYAAHIHIPILLMHGDRDGIVPVEHSQNMHHALEEAGRTVRYVEIEGAGHSGWSKDDRTTYYEEIEAFLAEHLPTERNTQ